MKNVFTVLRSKGLKVAVASAVAMVASSAHADIPAWATGILTTAQADITTLATAVGAAIALVVGFSLTTKLVKRFISKV
jgi:hypothetical protein